MINSSSTDREGAGTNADGAGSEVQVAAAIATRQFPRRERRHARFMQVRRTLGGGRDAESASRAQPR